MASANIQAKFTSAKKYQQAVKLWAKATMLGLETGSAAAARCADRMLVAIRLMVVPSGTGKGQFWIDCDNFAEYTLRNGYSTLGASIE